MKRIYPGKKGSKTPSNPEVKTVEEKVVPIGVTAEIIPVTHIEKDEIDIVLGHIGLINKPDGVDTDAQTAGIEIEAPYASDNDEYNK